ncbi:hypothetical protein ACFE04_005512 [Oxalis oulophora]
MECGNTTISGSSSPPSSPSSPILSPPQTTPTVVISPCAACKILRRRCADKCVLAPYFPPTEPAKFTIAHRVFGASNIIKFLQELPESQRADAVSSMVYEASARIRDPVYGSAGAISQLQKQVNELQAQLAKAHAEIIHMQFQQASFMASLCTEIAQPRQQQEDNYFGTSPQNYQNIITSPSSFIDDTDIDMDSLWAPYMNSNINSYG